MRRQQSGLVSLNINMFIGSLAILVVCAGLGLTANKLRSDSIALSMNSGDVHIDHYKRNELLYVRSSDIRDTTSSKYLFVDTRPFSKYKQQRISSAIHHSMVDLRDISCPIVIYGQNGSIKAAKKIAMKLLPNTHQDVFMMTDGFDGWKRNGLPTENGKDL